MPLRFYLCWLNAFAIALLMGAQALFADSTPATLLTMGVPQQLLLLPTMILLVLAWRNHRWRLFHLSALPLAGLFLLKPVFHLLLGQGDLRIITYNVQRFEAVHEEQIAEAVRKQNADVVCFQEVGPWPPPYHAPEKLIAGLPGYEAFWSGELLILSRHKIVSRVNHSLGAGPETRPCQETVIDYGGRKIRILNVHLMYLPWVRRNFMSSLKETTQIRQIQQKRLSNIVDQSSLPTALCGDFNALPQASIPRAMNSKLMNVFDTCGFGIGATIPSEFPLRRIDYIFTTPPLAPLGCQVLDVRLSDHRPFLARLRFR